MTAKLPLRSSRLVNPDGTATNEFDQYLRHSLAPVSVSTDLTALIAQVGTLADQVAALPAIPASVVALGAAYGFGFPARLENGTWSYRTLTGTANRLSVTDGIGTANPVLDIAATYVGQTSLTTLGTIEFGTWEATPVAADFGGTGQVVYGVGDLLAADTTTTLAKVSPVSAGYVLTDNGPGVAPSYQALPSGACPTTMTADYTVAADTQVLFKLPITVGLHNLIVHGDLVQVS